MFVANREADSLTVFAVDGGHEKAAKGNSNILTKLAEVPVGEEPVCVAADGRRAFVANAVSGTVSVVEWTGVGFEETAEFAVGTEPRGCALSGSRLYVTNFTEGTVAVVDTKKKKVVDKVKVGGNPYGITVVGNDVFVTQFFARLIDGGPGEGFDDGKEGVVQHFRRNNFNLDEITLAPLADSGFTANRVNLCQQFNPIGSEQHLLSGSECHRPALTPLLPRRWQECSRTSSNRRSPAMACSICRMSARSPSRPWPAGVNLNTNVQALVHVVDIASHAEREDLTVNLNQQIATEPDPPDPAAGNLAHLFGNDIVAMDADDDCENFFILSRGGNYVLKAQLELTASSTSAPRTTFSASRRATSRPASWWTKRVSWASSTTR